MSPLVAHTPTRATAPKAPGSLGVAACIRRGVAACTRESGTPAVVGRGEAQQTQPS